MSLVTPNKIEQKLKNLYLPFLKAWLQGEDFLPYQIPAGQAKFDNYVQLREELDALKIHQAKYGYEVVKKVYPSRRLGDVTIPEYILISQEKVFLRLCGNKQTEFQDFQADVYLIRDRLPQLETWLFMYPQQVIENHGKWIGLLDVCQYFIANPRPQLYVRELPVPVHTKFIEQHYGVLKLLLDFLLSPDDVDATEIQFERRYGLMYDEPKLIRLRFLDHILQETLGCPFSDISVRPSELRQIRIPVQNCIIVENKMTFLTLPQLTNTIAIWGHGFQVDLVREAEWLRHCAIYYWGDLDVQGFQILSQLRSLYPHTIAIMMDHNTLETYTGNIGEGKPTNVKNLPYLTLDEVFVYQQLLQNNQRLEQERIHHDYILRQLKDYIG
jgi:hypothetical protein